MTRTRTWLLLWIATSLLFGAAGCGRGLDLTVNVDDETPMPGETVTWTVAIENETACSTADDVDLPIAGPGAPLTFFLFAFSPSADDGGAEACRALTACTDASCFDEVLGETAIESVADQVRSSAGEALAGNSAISNGAIVTPTCEPLGVSLPEFTEGLAFVCEFPPIAAGAQATTSFSAVVPDSGSSNPISFAIALAGARGSDCSPGTEFADEVWALGGCLPETPASNAPTLSNVALAALALALLALGGLFVTRRREPA